MARASTFTSYLNVEPAKGIDQSLAALERKTNAALNRITQRAAAASAATSGGRPGQASAAIQRQAAAEREHAAALQRTARAADQAAAASQRVAAKHLLESNAARAAASSTTALERSLRLAAVAANVAQGPLGPLAGRLSAVATAVRELSGLRLGLVSAGALGATFVRAASSAQELKSKLYPLFDSQQQVNSAFRDTIRIANDARLSLEPVVDLYARLTLGGRDVGLSQQRITRVTEIAAKAARLSGGSQISQDAGLYQFAQGLGSGALAGDELKSVRENTLRLATAIADGLGVTIADLKRLGKEGKLTAEVVATALESQAARIDAEMGRLPVTIASATARLKTAFLALVNGGDEAYGITRTLGAGLNLLAENLGKVAQAAITLTIAYAATRAINMGKQVSADVSAWRAQRTAIDEARAAVVKETQDRLTATQAARTSAAERVVALRAERAEIERNVQAQRQATQALVNERNTLASRTGAGAYAGRIYDLQRLPKAAEEAARAETRLRLVQMDQRDTLLQLHRETEALSRANAVHRNSVILADAATGKFVKTQANMRSALSSLRVETGSLVVAKQRLRAAMEANTRSANVFASAGRALWGVIGPNLLGLAIGVLITSLLSLKSQHERVAAAADRMAEREQVLARMVNLTTGEIKEQNQALIENERLKAGEEVRTARRNFIASQLSLSADAGGRRGASGRQATPLVSAQIQRYLNDPSTVNDVSTELGRIARTSTSVAERRAAERAIPRLADVVTAATTLNDARAQERILLNGGTAADRARFLGEDLASGGAAQSDEDVAEARRNRAAATDDAAKAERELQQIQSRTDQRSDILSKYEERSTALRRAEIDTRRLMQMVGQEINDQRFITADNALGRGIYTQEMADADKARIDYGVRQPLRDVFEEFERNRDISMLRLDGYEAEAAALQRALTLQDDIGELGREDLERLIRQERQQLRINDALESRARELQGILDAANQTRDAFADMLTQLSRNPVNALKNFGSTILNNIAQIQARRLTERLFAGADERLRQLVTGSNGVERAAEILERNVRTAGEALPPMATAAERTATALENAANRIDATFGGPGVAVEGAGAGAAGIAGALADATSGRVAANDNGDTIIVTAPARNRPPVQGDGPTPSGTEAYTAVFTVMGENLDRIFKSGSFFTGIGKSVGKAVEGAQTGMMASGVLRALGVKQSSTGAAMAPRWLGARNSATRSPTS